MTYRDPLHQTTVADIRSGYVPEAHYAAAVDIIRRLRALLADLYPTMKVEHGAGDGNFSTEELERVKRELP